MVLRHEWSDGVPCRVGAGMPVEEDDWRPGATCAVTHAHVAEIGVVELEAIEHGGDVPANRATHLLGTD
jgi:hypothetical protein